MNNIRCEQHELKKHNELFTKSAINELANERIVRDSRLNENSPNDNCVPKGDLNQVYSNPPSDKILSKKKDSLN